MDFKVNKFMDTIPLCKSFIPTIFMFSITPQQIIGQPCVKSFISLISKQIDIIHHEPDPAIRRGY